MTTKTINVSIEDAKEGDLFTGTIDHNDVTFTVTGPLKGGLAHGGNLYVTFQLPYAVRRDPAPHYGSDTWRDVNITREVEVLEFAPGTVIRYGNDPALYIRNTNGTWSEAYLGSTACSAYANRLQHSDDDYFRTGVERGSARIVYNPKEEA